MVFHRQAPNSEGCQVSVAIDDLAIGLLVHIEMHFLAGDGINVPPRGSLNAIEMYPSTVLQDEFVPVLDFSHKRLLHLVMHRFRTEPDDKLLKRLPVESDFLFFNGTAPCFKTSSGLIPQLNLMLLPFTCTRVVYMFCSSQPE